MVQGPPIGDATIKPIKEDAPSFSQDAPAAAKRIREDIPPWSEKDAYKYGPDRASLAAIRARQKPVEALTGSPSCRRCGVAIPSDLIEQNSVYCRACRFEKQRDTVQNNSVSRSDLKLEFLVCGPLAIIAFGCAFFLLNSGIFRWILVGFGAWMGLVAVLNLSELFKRRK